MRIVNFIKNKRKTNEKQIFKFLNLEKLVKN